LVELVRMVNCANSGGFHTLKGIATTFERYFPEATVMTLEHFNQIDALARPAVDQKIIRKRMEAVAAAG
jgi:hypothetical protein